MTYPNPGQDGYGQPYGQQPPIVPGSPAPGYGPPDPGYRQPVSGQTYGAPPPGYGYPPPQQSKKRRWPWIALGVVLVVVLGCVGLSVAGVFSIGKAAQTASDNAAGKNAKAAAIGQPARDGKFEFTVTKVACGQKTAGSGLFKATAQGTFCLVTVRVRNIGKESQSFAGSIQKAYAGKTQFSDDGAAEFDVNSGSPTWDQDINPGNQVVGILVYDVPAGTKLTSIELHDSTFSGGVRVTLK